MTKEERLKSELEKLYGYRRQAILKNDIVWLAMTEKKISDKKREIEEYANRQPLSLFDVLNDRGEEVKNRVYKSLLKISLAADFVNDCAEEAKSILKELELNDFTLRSEAEQLCKLSQRIASFVIIPNQKVLADMMLDNDDFISSCHEAADKRLKDTLGL